MMGLEKSEIGAIIMGALTAIVGVVILSIATIVVLGWVTVWRWLVL